MALIVGPSAVMQAFRPRRAGAPELEARLLLVRNGRIARVAEHEEVERNRLAGRLERVRDCGQMAENALRLLVADRHDDGGARRERARRRRLLQRRDPLHVVLPAEEPEPENAVPKADRDPRCRDQEGGQHEDLEQAEPVGRDQPIEPCGDERDGRDDKKAEDAPAARYARVKSSAPAGRRPTGQDSAHEARVLEFLGSILSS
jgi:hypothetical protein